MVADQGDPTLDYKYEPMFPDAAEELLERIEANKDVIFRKVDRKKRHKHQKQDHHHHFIANYL